MCDYATGELSEKAAAAVAAAAVAAAAAAAAAAVLAQPWKEVPAKSRGVHLSGSIFNFPV